MPKSWSQNSDRSNVKLQSCGEDLHFWAVLTRKSCELSLDSGLWRQFLISFLSLLTVSAAMALIWDPYQVTIFNSKSFGKVLCCTVWAFAKVDAERICLAPRLWCLSHQQRATINTITATTKCATNMSPFHSVFMRMILMYGINLKVIWCSYCRHHWFPNIINSYCIQYNPSSIYGKEGSL